MKIKKFEDLDCWKEARKLRKMVSDVFENTAVRKDITLYNQIKGASLSIMANIAEGFESRTNRENIAFLTYARRSCGELRSHLYAALDDNFIREPDFNTIYTQSVLTGKLITSFINYLRRYNSKKCFKVSQAEDKTGL